MNDKVTISRSKTAAETAKSAGLKSLAQVALMTGKPVRTLNNWFNDEPKLFDIVIAGCAQKARPS